MNWTRVVRWVALGIAALIVLVIGAALLLLRSHSVQQRIVAYVLRSASQSTGLRLSTHNAALQLSKLTVELDGLTARGTEPAGAPPLLSVDHASVGLKIVSLLHGKWYLQDVQVDHPVVHLLVNRQGISNLPTPPKSSSQSTTDVFDLAIQHFLLDQGEIYYNNQKSAMQADVRDLQLKGGFENLRQRYSGTLRYDQGHLRIGSYEPIPHSLQAEFSATRSGMEIPRLVLSSGASQFVLKVALDNYSKPVVKGAYEARLVTGEFRRILKNPSLPAGVIQLTGSLAYQNAPNRPLLDSVSLQGQISSPALVVDSPSLGSSMHNLRARYTLARGNLDLSGIHADLLGGSMDGDLAVRDVSGGQQSRLRASLHSISIRDAAAAMKSTSLSEVNLAGSFNAQADATWRKGFENLIARTDAVLQAAIAGASGRPAAPLTGSVHARYVAASRLITLNDTYLRTPHTSVTVNGTLGDHSALAVRANSSDLHDLELLAIRLRKPAPGQPWPEPLDIYGAGSFNGTVQGSTANPRVTGQLQASNLEVKKSYWRVLRANVDLSPSQASLTHGDLQSAGRGRLTFNVSAGLKRWSYTPESPIAVNLNASQLSASDLLRLAGENYPVFGNLAANVSVRGSQRNPLGQGKITLTQARISEQPVQNLTVQFNGTGSVVNASLNLTTAAGSAQGKLVYHPKTEAYQAQLQARNIDLAKLQAAKARSLDLKGLLTILASGEGTLRNPELQASAQIPQLTAQGQTINNLRLQVNVRNQVATLDLGSAVADTYVRASGTVGIRDAHQADLKFDTQNIPLQPLVAMYLPSQAANIGGETEVHAWLRGPLSNRTALQGHLEIPRLSVQYQAMQLAAAAPIVADYRNGVVDLQRTQIKGTGTNIQVQGAIPIGSSAPASLTMKGTLDLGIARMFQPNLNSSGQLQFDIASRGTPAHPALQGQVRVVNATYVPSGAPTGIEQANGVITLDDDRVNITQFQAQLGGGQLTLQGGATLRPALRFNLAAASTGSNLSYQGIRIGFDSNLALTGTPQESYLRGQVRLDRLGFTSGFDVARVASQFSSAAPPPSTSPLMQNLHLAVAVQSASELSLASSKMSLQANANLRVQGTAADPVVLGRIDLAGGEMLFMSNRYVIQGGTISFSNPVETRPVLNLRVSTTIDQYNILMTMQGPVDRLRTHYSSDPALPPADIINLLAFGKTTEAAAMAPPTSPTMGAESLVASGVTSQVSSRVEKLAGISNISINPNIGGQPGQSGPVISVQQRVTGNIYVTFVTDVTATQREQIEVDYRVSPRLSFSGFRDQNGGFAFDTKIHQKF